MAATSSEPCSNDSLVEAALKCLNQPDPWIKAEYTRKAVGLWRTGQLKSNVPAQHTRVLVPDRPARSDEKVKVVAPGNVQKRGRGGTLASRCAIIHSLCHIESWAVDLAWDAIARFGIVYTAILPRKFYDDFVSVADDECRHFLMLEQRLKDLGSYYGALPVHDGLWESASKSAGSLAARLAVEHCVHEARGLDVIPATISKFRAAGDKETADLLECTIYPEEVGHCAAGVRWLTHLHAHAHGIAKEAQSNGQSNSTVESNGGSSSNNRAPSSLEGSFAGLALQDPEHDPRSSGHSHWEAEARQFPTVQAWFHSLVRAHFNGPLKPPFNTEARAKAGFDPEWYLPLAVITKDKRSTKKEAEAEDGDE